MYLPSFHGSHTTVVSRRKCLVLRREASMTPQESSVQSVEFSLACLFRPHLTSVRHGAWFSFLESCFRSSADHVGMTLHACPHFPSAFSPLSSELGGVPFCSICKSQGSTHLGSLFSHHFHLSIGFPSSLLGCNHLFTVFITPLVLIICMCAYVFMCVCVRMRAYAFACARGG